ncbi:MAG TPA: site-2 protease family protein [Nitrososphaera sp.]|nr:site-2 protease family protein [Nitrososphaera sp.]
MATSFLNGDYARVLPIISSFFTVKDFQRNVREDYAQFLIADSQIKDKFPSFLKELGKVGMVAAAKRSKYVSRLMPTLSTMRLSVDDGIVLTVVKMQKQKPKNRYRQSVPALLFITTICIVLFDGIFRSSSPLASSQVQNPILLAGIYTLSLMGILGIHELGHVVANRKYGIKASWPYFLPGLPVIGIPTFGALIVLRGHMTNRNVMFDVGIAGPIAGLIVTIIVSIYGSTISTLITSDEAERLFGENRLGRLPFGESALMMATVYLTGMGAENMVLVISPVLFAAWLGFLITFMNLMPAWQLDGGHLARSALGVRWHKILTYASIAILFVIGLYPMALLILFFSMRAPESAPLDDVTPLSSTRKALFFVALGLAVLCAPIPSELFGFISLGS